MERLTPAILAALRDARRILLLTHVHPDGDALGSQLALLHCLRRAGREVTAFGEAPVSHLYDFLPGADLLVTEPPDPAAVDCVVAVDCGDADRLGRAGQQFLPIQPFVVIDHHGGHREFGTLRWVDARRAATGEMVYDLLQALDLPIDRDTAFCLYTAIVSDTGSFRYAATSSRTLVVAGELVALGVRPEEVASRLYDNYSVGRLDLLQRVLATLELHEDERLAIIAVTREMLARTGTRDEDTEGFVNFPRSIASVRVAVFVKEGPDGMVGVSLRSKEPECDVAAVARSFGGGGHCNAAGFKVAGQSLAQVKDAVVAALRPVVRR